jgi:hypothetical protein
MVTLSHHAECRVLFIVILNVIMLSVVTPSDAVTWGGACVGTTSTITIFVILFHKRSFDISSTRHFIDFLLRRPTKTLLTLEEMVKLKKANLPKTSTRALRSFYGVGLGRKPTLLTSINFCKICRQYSTSRHRVHCLQM